MRSKLKETAGFTLVELIVVIAILGILAGVGGVAYAGYVERANKGVDQQLVADVKYALTLAAMEPGNPLSEGGGMVTLSTGNAVAGTVGGADAEKQAATETAMEDAFGSDWQTTLKLKYGEWKAEKLGIYQDSNFSGNETELVTQVGTLTKALSAYLGGLGGSGGANFEAYLNEHGISSDDPTAMANAAVTYVASRNSALTPEKRDLFVSTLANLGEGGGDVNDAIEQVMGGVYEGSTLPAMASIYAMMAAMGQYEAEQGSTQINDALSSIDFNSPDPLGSVNSAMSQVMGIIDASSSSGGWAADYMRNELAKDAEAYLSLMDMVTNNEEELLRHVNDENLYQSGGTAEDLMNDYLTNSVFGVEARDGEIVVAISKVGDDVKAMSTIDLE